MADPGAEEIIPEVMGKKYYCFTCKTDMEPKPGITFVCPSCKNSTEPN